MTVFKAVFHHGTTYALHRRIETARIWDHLYSELILAGATSESTRWAWPNSKRRLTRWLALGFELRRGASGALERVAGAARDSRTRSAIRHTIDIAVSESFMPGLPHASAGKVTFPPGSPISRLPLTRAGHHANSPRDRHATKWRGSQRACLRFGARVAGGPGDRLRAHCFVPGLPHASAGKVAFPPRSPIPRHPEPKPARRGFSARPARDEMARAPTVRLRFAARIAGGRGAARPLFRAGVAARKCGKGDLPPRVADTPAPFFSDPVPARDRVIASLPAALRTRETARTLKLPDAAHASP